MIALFPPHFLIFPPKFRTYASKFLKF